MYSHVSLCLKCSFRFRCTQDFRPNGAGFEWIISKADLVSSENVGYPKMPWSAILFPLHGENLGQQQTAGCNSSAGPSSQKKTLPTAIVCQISQHVIPFCLSLSRFSLYICSIVFPCSSTWVSLSFLGLPQLFSDAYLIWISLNWLCPNIWRVSQCVAIQHLAGENVGNYTQIYPVTLIYHLLDAHYFKCNWVYLMISMDDIHG